MDEWYDIGTHINCKTCLGKEVSGILVSYDIDQKLMFLKRTNGKSSNNNNNSICSPSSSSFSSSSQNAKPYVLLNLRFISEITEVEDSNSSKEVSLVNDFINSDKNSNNNDRGDSFFENLDKKDQEIINSVNPSSKLDMDKLKSRLSSNRAQKFEEAKLADTGVTRNGLDLFQEIKKTMDVRWQDSNLIILDDVKISPPYDLSSVEKVRPDAKDQTMEQVKKRIEKFYNERDQQEINAAIQ